MSYAAAMTADLVNLRQVRKQKKRALDEAKAADNRARHGQSKAEKTLRSKQTELASRQLEGHRLERPEDERD